MFYYYGTKKQLAKYYPKPKKDVIVEPFCGAAQYSLKYWKKDVFLYDIDELIIRLWQYLQSATEQDVKSLPRFKAGDDIRDFKLSEGESLFCGYMAGISFAKRNIVSSMASKTINNDILKISKNLYKIKHWQVKRLDYKEIPNIDATWFIDPPYIKGGHKYRYSNKNIDYDFLAEWCKTRSGDVIVCENADAGWLDFLPIVQINGNANHKKIEAMWTNFKTEYHNIKEIF